MGEEIKAQWRKLYDFALRRVRDPHISEDIAQETLSRMMSYESDQPVANRSALAFAIARNLLRDHFRARRPTAELDESLVSPLPLADEVVLQRQYLAEVQRVIEAMPPLRRDIFVRRRINGETPGEIAAALGLSAAAVEKHLVRGLADLHEATGWRGRR